MPIMGRAEFNYLLQAANILQLFTFIKRDLATHRPKSDSVFADTSSTSLTVFDAPPIGSPSFPKSLYLIHPLCSAYELNPVASVAQTSVPIPDGLDLDAWIVPSMQVPLPDEDEGAGEVASEKKVKKSKKGKEKESAGRSKFKGTKKRKEDEGIEELIAQEEVETPEEMAEREQVSCACLQPLLVI